jgi:serine/threonine-protein kinase
MAPEQARAERHLTTAADVYALGAILYQLLTGQPPFQAPDMWTLMQLVREAEPVRPRSLDRTVDRDLETVALRCLEKEPARRYGSAEALAEELERWLRGEPVQARPTAVWERVWKWAKRRPAVAALAAALGLVTLGSIVGLAGLYRQSEGRRVQAETARADAERDRDEAREQRRRARRALDDMLSDESLAFLTTQQKLMPEQRTFLERALTYYQGFAAQAGSDAEGRSQEAGAHQRVARIAWVLGQSAQAVPAGRRAVDLYARLADDDPADPEHCQHLALAHNYLAVMLENVGQRAEAEVAYRAALAVQQKLARDFPAESEYRYELAMSHVNLGILLRTLERPAEAEAAQRTAAGLYERLAAEVPANPTYRRELAVCHNNLAVLLDLQGRVPEAAAAYRDALAVLDRLADEHPADSKYRRYQAGLRTNLGALLREQGKLAEAEAAYRAAIVVNERLANDYPAVPDYRQALATSHYNLGNLLKARRRPGDAEAAYRASLAVLEKLAADHDAVPAYRQELAFSHKSLGLLLAGLGRRPEAETGYRAALRLHERLVADHPGAPEYAAELGQTCNNFGNFLGNGGDPMGALPWYDRAIEVLGPVARKARGAAVRRRLCETYWNRATMLDLLGRYAEAVSDWDRAMEWGDESNRTALRASRAKALARAGDVARAVAEAEAVVGVKDADLEARYLCVCAFAAAAAQDTPDAERYAARAVALLRQSFVQGYTDVAYVLKDPDLDVMRRRSDYIALLWDLADGLPPTRDADTGSAPAR